MPSAEMLKIAFLTVAIGYAYGTHSCASHICHTIQLFVTKTIYGFKVLKKAKPKKTLSKWEKLFNKIIGQTRFKVERTFGGIKRWFNGGIARYRGLKKMHTQNIMEAMCYNLYRSPGIITSNCEN